LASYQTTSGLQSQVTAGGSWQVNLNERDSLTLGLEGFYNGAGYSDDGHILPALIGAGAYSPFYVGRYYGATYATVALPRGQTTHTVTLTTFGNFSDGSFLSRLDYNVQLRNRVILDFYSDAHYGTPGGEFRFGFNSSQIASATTSVPTISVPTPLIDFGAAVRVTF